MGTGALTPPRVSRELKKTILQGPEDKKLDQNSIIAETVFSSQTERLIHLATFSFFKDDVLQSNTKITGFLSVICRERFVILAFDCIASLEGNKKVTK